MRFVRDFLSGKKSSSRRRRWGTSTCHSTLGWMSRACWSSWKETRSSCGTCPGTRATRRPQTGSFLWGAKDLRTLEPEYLLGLTKHGNRVCNKDEVIEVRAEIWAKLDAVPFFLTGILLEQRVGRWPCWRLRPRRGRLPRRGRGLSWALTGSRRRSSSKSTWAREGAPTLSFRPSRSNEDYRPYCLSSWPVTRHSAAPGTIFSAFPATTFCAKGTSALCLIHEVAFLSIFYIIKAI